MTSANSLPYRVFQRDRLIGAFEAHDEAVSWCKDVASRTITTFDGVGHKPITEPCRYSVSRYDREVFSVIAE